ncbi:low-specificity L-threonine aldolase [Clostridium tetani]|uniref:Low-specificity L-threonine aldolase n=1 Tax=Clostridium tetani TaxID=1513 RepID=A0ABY0ES54_CLOTA|nr:low-specificity L-threonine aldolase [Clostridium tetani]CDI49108.1 L-allo-threonine aldolase [Clostridium tetani 12124569]KHO39654.1 threonine aldolase [Clostridium tetani]RXI38654.1 low-specificity L-threonine aldolase [Clostridium tetani]RXI55461.1 low-specificity L-threonine aldolase [Clostridium tetani]RXI68532.1 low-specificity L-threonine aldolase [Clostridium tetani]
MDFLDLRSDTVTKPTENMRKAMFEAAVGDDVYGDDPTVNELEEYAAKLVGKEAALFVPSGVFGNQLSLFTHCKRGDEVILGEDCHIIMHETGAPAVIAGVQLRPIKSENGFMSLDDIQSKIRGENIHFPDTSLICVENAHSCGRVISLKHMEKIYNISRQHNIPIHLDGARLFNAVAYLDVDVKDITKYCDSVMFSLSKGLCAPVGSILAGSKDFTEKARKKRKLMGGGLRQAGVLAAPGLVALKEMIPQLKKDYENALLLGKELSKIPNIKVNLEDININMVFFSIENIDYDEVDIVNKFYSKGIKINGTEDGKFRFATHYWIKEEDISYIVETMKTSLQ